MVFLRPAFSLARRLAQPTSARTFAPWLLLASACGSNVTPLQDVTSAPSAVAAGALEDLAKDTHAPWQGRALNATATPAHLQALGPALLPTAPTRGEALLRMLEKNRKLFRLAEVQKALRVDREEEDELGMTHVRLRQMVRGVRVLDGEMLAHFGPNGELRTVDAHIDPAVEGLSTVPNLAGEEALAKATAFVQTTWGQASLRREAAHELVIHAPEGKAPRLTYHVRLPVQGDGVPANFEVFVDALSGEVFDSYDSLNEATGSGQGVDGKTKPLNVNQSPMGFELYDATRGGGIRTKDCINGQNPNCFPITSDSPHVWDNFNFAPGAAVDAHFYLGVVYDYFKAKHNRLGLDGKDGPLLANVHFEQNMANAFWDGEQMYFGDGNGADVLPFSGCLDVVGHELVHGLTQHTSGLVYRNQSGALDESVSDIFGQFVDHFLTPNSKTLWLLGTELRRDGQPGRDMINPSKKKQPGHMSRYVTTTQDNGGVHINSGIPNNAAYLMTMGGVNEVSNIRVEAGIGWEKAEKVWYRAATRYLTSTSGFLQAAEGTLTAAKDLNLPSQDVNIIECAWIATGVLQGTCKPVAPPQAEPSPGSGSGANSGVEQSSGPGPSSPGGSNATPTSPSGNNGTPATKGPPSSSLATPTNDVDEDGNSAQENQGIRRTVEVSACAVSQVPSSSSPRPWLLLGTTGLATALRRPRRRLS